MANPLSTLHRRDFLGSLLTASASLGIAGLALSPELAAAQDKKSSPSGDKEFEAWLKKIKGKHRQVFDAPSTNSGYPLAWARVFQMTNEKLGVAPGDVGVVVVLRHNAIPLAMENRLWEKYKFGEVFNAMDEATKTALVMNPFWQPKEGSLPLPGMSLDQLQKSGVLFGVCDMALTVYSTVLGGKIKMDPVEIKKDWVSGIFPGIQIVPSGVLAVNRAQEHGCTYCYAGEG